jgi:gliding motility-associated protein GldL
MSRKKLSFKDNFYINVAPIITGVGASIVILGALFKIQHYTGASEMLIVGMSVEAVIFLMFAFAPIPHEPDWSLVYPQLADDYDPIAIESGKEGPVSKLNDMMDKAKIDQQLVEKLGRGMSNLSDSVSKMGELSNASVATAEYAKNVKSASSQLVEMNKSYDSTISSMKEMAGASNDAKAYHSQVIGITKNLGALNAVYESELKDASSHLKSLNSFYGSVAKAMENISAAGNESAQFRTEMSKLTQNLTSLNNVYGSMLTAMRGGAPAPAAK